MGVSKQTRRTVLVRSGGLCEACGIAFKIPHIHHRKPRGMGGGGDNGPANLLALHPSCHMDTIESLREVSLTRGWLVPQGVDPSTVPVLYRLKRWVLLNNDGTITETST